MTDMNKDREEHALDAALQRLKQDDAEMGASAGVEARLRAEVRVIQRQHARRSRMRILQVAAVIAIVVIPAGFWIKSVWPPGPSVTAPALVSQEVTTEFFPLFYSSVPSASMHVVRMDVPRASLARFGFVPVDGMDGTTGTVLADLVVGDDGLARAVRFVHRISKEQ